ncbi:unnamed protein product, partial [Didymodactylos carnosus]
MFGYGYDIVAIQEHRQRSKDTEIEYRYSDDGEWLLGLASATEEGNGGVGLLMKTKYKELLMNIERVSDRIIVAYFAGNPALTILSAYAPIDTANGDEKILILFSVIPFITTFKCQLYGADQSSLETTFTEIINSTSYDRIINLGRVSFSGTATSVKIDNQKYVGTYHTSNSLGVPHYFLLIIDIHSKSIKRNLTLNEKRDSGSFWQIAAPNSNEIVGIRESFHAESSLEVAKINQTNSLMETIGIHLYGSHSFVMVYASKRRLYYNVIESTFYA